MKQMYKSYFLILGVFCFYCIGLSTGHPYQEDKNLRISITSTATISPISASFYAQSYLEIAGIKNGTGAQKVELFNRCNSFLVQIVSQNETSVKCLFKGGKQGTYQARVFFEDLHSIETSNSISLEVKINQITPNSGNYKGGVLLTLFGENFSYINSENKVFVGDIACEVLFSNSTLIKCIIQPALAYLHTHQIVQIRSNGGGLSTYEDQQNILYEFVEIQNAPVITQIGSNTNQFIMGETVNVYGNNLVVDEQETIVLIGSTQIKWAQHNSGISFIVPYDISTKQQDLRILVGSNGCTESIPFKVLLKLNKIRCLNPENKLTAFDNVLQFFTVSITGKSSSDSIQLAFNQNLHYKEVLSQQSFAHTEILFSSVNIEANTQSKVTKLTGILVNRENILLNPVEIEHKISNTNIKLLFTVQTHPIDSDYFQIVFEPEYFYLDLQVYDVIMSTESDYQAFFYLEKENNLNFKYPKLAKKGFLAFKVCSNYAFASIDPKYYDEAIATQNPIRKVSIGKYLGAGDIVRFKIPEGNMSEYFLCVMCVRRKKDPDNENTDKGSLQYFQEGKDVYRAYPFQSQKDEFSFYFPSILKRSKSTLQTCDMTIQYAKANNHLLIDDLYLKETTDSQFIHDIFNSDNGSDDLGKYIWMHSSTQKVFPGSVIPKKSSSYVSNISPQEISAYGGEQITLTGKNLFQGKTKKVVVKLLGVVCSVQSLSDTQIVCISGEKMFYDILEIAPTEVVIGGISVLVAAEVRYVFSYNDQVKFRYFNNEFLESKNLYVPAQYSLIVDLGELFEESTLYLSNIGVDGSLVFQNSKQNQSVYIDQIVGKGSVRFGTVDSPILMKVKYIIGVFNVAVASGYGVSSASSCSFTLLDSLDAGSSSIRVQEQISTLDQGAHIRLLSLSLDQEDEDLIISNVDSTSTSDTIYLTSEAKISRQNINETHFINAVHNYTFQYSQQALVTSRNLEIIINSTDQVSWTAVQNANLVIENTSTNAIIQTITNSVVELGASSQIDLVFPFIASSSLFLKESTYWKLFSSEISSSFILSLNKIAEVSFFNHDDLGLNLAQSFTSRINLNFNSMNKQLTLSNNIFTRSGTCLSFQAEKSYPISGKSNICLSSNNVASSLPNCQLSSTSDVFLYALDIREAFITSSTHSSQAEISVVCSTSSSPQYVVIANTLEQDNSNQPVLVRMNSESNEDQYPIYLLDIVIKGFSGTQTNKLIQKSSQQINVIDVRGLIFDKTTSQSLYSATDTQSLVLVDNDGSLSGGIQTLLSSNIALPKYNCSTNCIGYHVCTVTLALIKVLLDQHLHPWIGDRPRTEYIVVLDDIEIDSDNRLIVEGSVTQLKVVNATRTSQNLVPYTIYLSIQYSQTYNTAYLIRYNFDRSVYQISSYFPSLHAGNVEINASAQPFLPETCIHGQNYFDAIGLVVCLRTVNVPILLTISPLDSYPSIFPLHNDFSNLSLRSFEQAADWFSECTTFQSSKRWKILPSWNMVLSTSGIYEIPSLEVQGQLTIDLGEEGSVIIKTKGIAISGGAIIVQSGHVTFELINDGSTEIIFKYFYEDLEFSSGSFVVNSIFKTDTGDVSSEFWNQYRVVSVNSSNKKKIIVSQPSNYQQFNIGDIIIITSPMTSLTLQTTIIAVAYAADATYNLEIADEYLYDHQYITRSYLEQEFDFRPIVAKVSKNIVIKNANMIVNSYVDQVFAEIDLVGVQFQNTTIQLNKWFNNFSIQDCSFVGPASSLSSPLTTLISIKSPILTLHNQFMNVDATVLLQNNVFAFADTFLSIERYGSYYLDFYYDHGYKMYTSYKHSLLTDSEALLLHKVTLNSNIFVGATTTAINLDSLAVMSENIVIGSSHSCLASPRLCQITQQDQFFDCGASGISGDCNKLSNVLVARSGMFSNVNYASYTSVVSIENDSHFILKISNIKPNDYFFNYETAVYSSSIVYNLFDTSCSCKPQTALSFSVSDSSNKYARLGITFRNTTFIDVNSNSNSIIKITTANSIYPIFNLINTVCINCSITETNLIQLPKCVTSLPDSFRGQDITGNFINPANRSPVHYSSNSQDPFYKSTLETSAFSWVMIQQLNYKSQSRNEYFTLNEEKTNMMNERNGTALGFVQNANQYVLSADNNLNFIRIVYQSARSDFVDYVIIKLQVRAGYQLLIKDSAYERVLPTSSNLDTPETDIQSLIAGEQTKLYCGMNIQNQETLFYFVLLLSNENCILTFQEVLSTTIKFTIATPILPAPSLEEEGKCDSDRRTAYVLDRVCALLGIDATRARLLGKSNSICSNSRRMLQTAETETYLIIIDPVSAGIPSESGEIEDDDSEPSIIEEMSNVVKNLDQLSTPFAKSVGLSVGHIFVQIPSFSVASLCKPQEFLEDGICKSACSANYFASGRVCYQCSPHCDECTGSTKYDCKTCADMHFIMTDTQNIDYCGKCPDNCKACSSQVSCSECSDNYFLSKEKCVNQCPSQTFRNNEGACQECPTGCKTCVSASECTDCSVGTWNSSTNQCENVEDQVHSNLSKGSKHLNWLPVILILLIFL